MQIIPQIFFFCISWSFVDRLIYRIKETFGLAEFVFEKAICWHFDSSAL